MYARLGRLGRLTRKELSECLRDRRTILTLLLMPLLLYPILAMAFFQIAGYKKIEKEWPRFYVGLPARPIENNDENSSGKPQLQYLPAAANLYRFWTEIGIPERLRRHTPPGQTPDRDHPPTYLENVPRLEVVPILDPEQSVREGVVDVALRPRPSEEPRQLNRRGPIMDWELLYRPDSPRGHDAVRYLEILTAEANAWDVTNILKRASINLRGDPVRVQAVAVLDENRAKSSILPILIPLILILMTMTGAVYPAIDLTAGERERGTLEILIAAPIPRLDVLLAKYFAVWTVALLTALVNLGMMALTLFATGIGPAVFGASLTVLNLLQVLALLVLFAAFFSAVLLSLTSFARSFKEAQSYLIPLMLLCLAPGLMALMDFPLGGPLAVAPLINIVLLAREILSGKADLLLTALVVATTLLYAVAAILLASRIFGAEAVLTSESSGWSELVRRPSEPSRHAAASTAMLCLALLFPVNFLLNAGLAQLRDLPLETRLVLASVLNLLLFVGVPMFVFWRGRVLFRSGFALRGASVVSLLAALLLGVSLWPLVHEAVVVLRQLGLSTLPESLQQESKKLLDRWRELSPVFIVLAMAVLPAIAEELFFRGFLLQALLGEERRPGRAIVASAALFAIFHLFVSNSVAVERLLPSFLMGLVLGTLAYRAGSVLPGILLHLLHNGCIVLLGYYEPQLTEAGWLVAEQQHYPVWLLAGSVALALVGFTVLRLTRQRVS